MKISLIAHHHSILIKCLEIDGDASLLDLLFLGLLQFRRRAALASFRDRRKRKQLLVVSTLSDEP
jgi:hypothetical protein